MVAIPRGRKIALCVCLFLITGSFGFLQPFTSPYYAASGLDKTQIGLITGLGMAIAVLIQPLFGKLSDKLDARRPLMVLAGLLAGAAYLLFRSAQGFWGFLTLTALGGIGIQFLNTVGGVLVGRLAQAGQGGAAYAKYRVWGSVGYICIGITAGFLLPAHPGMSHADLAPIFTYGPLLFFLIAAVSLCVPDIKLPKSIPFAEPVSPLPPSGSAKRGLSVGLKHFFVAYFLYQFALYGASAYLPLFMKHLGATPRQVSLMFAAGVICEVLVMTQVGKWTDKNGRKPALIVAFCLMPIRLILYTAATTPAMVMAIQSLHGINYGIVGTLAVVYVNDCVTDAQRGTAQAALMATSGIAISVSPALCGWLANTYSFDTMFIVMSLVGMLGATYLVAHVPESNPTPRERGVE
ncbi:MFS transporter [Armatimonas sp.]|uniref:MFS transporter n=1 Tax=Armatimonas sp. TaxID=1872638 RepID=UPI00286A9B90|nr:MFS transporter [Armatimonas sp.]